MASIKISSSKKKINIDNIKKYYWTANQHISMISEGYYFQNVNIVVCIHQAQLLITVKLYTILYKW